MFSLPDVIWVPSRFVIVFEEKCWKNYPILLFGLNVFIYASVHWFALKFIGNFSSFMCLQFSEKLNYFGIIYFAVSSCFYPLKPQTRFLNIRDHFQPHVFFFKFLVFTVFIIKVFLFFIVPLLLSLFFFVFTCSTSILR